MSVLMMKQRVSARREERELGVRTASNSRIQRKGATSEGTLAEGDRTPRRWRTAREIAAHLGASEYWVMEKARQGILPSHKVSHLRFFLLEEVEDAILAL